MILISACLCGLNCRYDGRNCLNSKVKELYDKGNCIAICPENLGTLAVPRPPHEISLGDGKAVLNGNARIISNNGVDNTEKFLLGAHRTLDIAKHFNIETAILKSKSPSCGWGQIYDGSFNGRLISGNGVAAELLHQHGIRIITENDID